MTDYEVRLTDKSNDSEVQTVLADYVEANGGKLGDFNVIVPSG